MSTGRDHGVRRRSDGTTRRRAASLLAGTAVALGTLLVGASTAAAATFTVTGTNDSGAGSLRAAITSANADPAGAPHLIEFASGATGVIELETALPQLREDVEIRGPGSSQLTIGRDSSASEFRILAIIGAAVEISGVTIADGQTAVDGGAGLNVFIGELTLRDMVVRDNVSADRGGGILSSGSTVRIVGSAFQDNSAQGGGGIFVSGDSTVTLRRSSVSDNASSTAGGGILNFGTILVRDSTIEGNEAVNGGSGIQASSAGETRIVNSTVSGNRTPHPGFGPGVRVAADHDLVLRSSTLAANDVTGGTTLGENLYLFTGGNGLRNARSTIFAQASEGTSCLGTSTLVSHGFNLTDQLSCAFGGRGDLQAPDAGLGPLAENGGPTRTHALLAGSPAIDKGVAGALASDQRGLPRRSNFFAIPDASDGADIGAFERISNQARIVGVARNLRRGTARLRVRVAGQGRLILSPSESVRANRRRARGPGVVALVVRPRGVAQRRLNRTGSVRVQATITFNPDGAPTRTITRQVLLRRR